MYLVVKLSGDLGEPSCVAQTNVLPSCLTPRASSASACSRFRRRSSSIAKRGRVIERPLPDLGDLNRNPLARVCSRLSTTLTMNWGETFSYDEDEGLTDETPTTSALSDPNLHRQSQHGFYA
jgi:hypothetical protein